MTVKFTWVSRAPVGMRSNSLYEAEKQRLEGLGLEVSAVEHERVSRAT
jgi:hypothetical protein